LQIHERDVRLVRSELLDRFAPIRRFGDYTHVRLPTHERSNSSAQNRMIVHRQNPNRARLRTHDFISVSFPDNFSAMVNSVARLQDWPREPFKL
jgi:hypothetical protein